MVVQLPNVAEFLELTLHAIRTAGDQVSISATNLRVARERFNNLTHPQAGDTQ